jgi:hypothetical protein
MDTEYYGMKKEETVAQFEVLSWYLLGAAG